MRIQLSSSELQRLLPVSPGTAAHCRRVAALCREIGARLPLSWRAMVVLDQSALLHHAERARFEEEIPEDLDALLSAFHGRPSGGWPFE